MENHCVTQPLLDSSSTPSTGGGSSPRRSSPHRSLSAPSTAAEIPSAHGRWRNNILLYVSIIGLIVSVGGFTLLPISMVKDRLSEEMFLACVIAIPVATLSPNIQVNMNMFEDRHTE